MIAAVIMIPSGQKAIELFGSVSDNDQNGSINHPSGNNHERY
jgi:hypothetical protein